MNTNQHLVCLFTLRTGNSDIQGEKHHKCIMQRTSVW